LICGVHLENWLFGASVFGKFPSDTIGLVVSPNGYGSSDLPPSPLLVLRYVSEVDGHNDGVFIQGAAEGLKSPSCSFLEGRCQGLVPRAPALIRRRCFHGLRWVSVDQ
jgi:hypothetical protein